MGALWMENDKPADRSTLGDLITGLVRAIDLRRLSPYHRPAPGPAERRRTVAHPPVDQGRNQTVRAGLWMPEQDRAQRRNGERIKRWLRVVLHTDDTPARAALAFAIGVFIAWTPVLGLHTVLALGIAFLFGLNRVAVLAGTFVNNPWTFVPIYSTSAWIGSVLTGSDAALPRLHEESSWESFGSFLEQIRPWIVPMTTGTLVLGTLCALISFPVILYGIRWYRSLRHAG